MFRLVFLLTLLNLSVNSTLSEDAPILISKRLKNNENFTFSINSSVEYIFHYNVSNVLEPPRVWMHSFNASVNKPLIAVARQPSMVISWQLPLIIEGASEKAFYTTTSRGICYDTFRNGPQSDIYFSSRELVISASTVSDINLNSTINIKDQDDFVIKPSVYYKFAISPSEPRYYYYNFTNNETLKAKDSNYETVILEVNSDDDICMTVSIQNASCPVFDTVQDVKFRGFFETVNRKGGMTISKNKFPNGFYIVFVAKADNYDCTHDSSRLEAQSSATRIKNISLIIKPSITYSDYVNAIFLTLSAIGAFYVAFGVAFIFCSIKSRPRQMQYVQDAPSFLSSRIINTAIQEEGTGSTVNTSAGASVSTAAAGAEILADAVSLDETDYDVVPEIETDRSVRLCRGQPCLSDLAMKDLRVLKKKSYLYLYNVLTMAIFYGLPVVQLVIIYQQILNNTGEQDLCFYNFLCAHPLGFLSDFNHVFSNIGYVTLGSLFIFITYNRERSHRDIDFDRQFGIPQHYGMYYAMGVGLVMEGILSGCYHVCPSLTNYQFDTSFMYVVAVLCIIKLYQNRHPDINATAYATFGLLALAILLGMIGIFEATVYFWSCFIVFYLLICFYLTIKVYYMGCWTVNRDSLRNIYHVCVYDFWSGPLNVIKPHYKARFVLLALGNICNWMLAFFGLYNQPNKFPSFLLAIFMMNTVLYFIFYIVMKYVNKERLNWTTWICNIISLMCAVSAIYFFLQKSISWTSTPAESRKFNKECAMLRFYDAHDIWHFLSAVGMFFIFMVMLTLDDDISHTHHSKIPVF